jgi:hypothetical protein
VWVWIPGSPAAPRNDKAGVTNRAEPLIRFPA